MPKRSGVVVALFLIFVGTIGVWYWHTQRGAAPETLLTLYGNVDIRQVELAFNGNERITRVLVEEGVRVKKEQLLATLDTRRLQAILAHAEAQVAAQQQVVSRLEAGTRAEEISKARAEVAAAKAAADEAELIFSRRRQAREQVFSREETDRAQAVADTARARQHAAEEALRLALAGPRKEDIASARAMLKAYEAQRDLAKVHLADASLYAPADGIIRSRLLEAGDMASPARPVYALALTNPVRVRAYVSETALGKIYLGRPATLHTDSYPDKSYRGWLGYISPTAEFTPKSVQSPDIRTDLVYQVYVYVCDPQDELRLGMPVTVRIDLAVPKAGSPDPCEDS